MDYLPNPKTENNLNSKKNTAFMENSGNVENSDSVITNIQTPLNVILF